MMKKSIRAVFFTLLAAFLAAMAVMHSGSAFAAYSRESYGWYCKRTGHDTPILESRFSFISDHGGYFLGDPREKVLYLTFDAGYENGNIERILDTLKKHEVKGAFFILDNLIRRNTDLVVRMAEEGHTVCNHTAKHKDMTKVTDRAEFEKELTALSSVYHELTGHKMAKYYRPPEGKFSEENLAFADALGYKTIFWSFAYADWDNGKQPDPQKAVKLILENTHNGAVILLHPTSKTNADILETLILEWKKQGYRFGTLDELCTSGG